MKMITKYGLVALSLTLLMPVAQADDKTQLFVQINQRLAYMKDVAGYKAANHQPIEDLQQEARVSVLTLSSAEKFGLQAASVKPFVKAQMDAAKAIQYRYRADWLSKPEVKWTPLSLPVVREKIGQLSTDSLQQLAKVLKAGNPINENDRVTFNMLISQHNITDNDKTLIFDALKNVALK
ncbi:chorismate mutase [Winslowiella toletana]|nr:chorismate mutase [Winslowiella toletana]WNN45298.1 chorismate mutase [Winslowiella toletana]